MDTIFVNKHRAKLINAILYFAANVKNPSKLKIFKLLFFLDFKQINAKGKPVTNLEYFAWPQGPVPKKLFENFESPELLEHYRIDKKQYNDQIEGHYIVPKHTCDMNVFTPNEKKIMDDLIFIYKDTKPKDMSEITHLKGAPWHTTKMTKGDNELIDYILALDENSTLNADFLKEHLAEHEEFVENYKIRAI